MDFLSAGWLWMYIGGGLMLAEILMPGFVVFFFGLSAVTLGGQAAMPKSDGMLQEGQASARQA